MALTDEGYTDIGNVDQGDPVDPAYGDNIRTNQALFASLFSNMRVKDVNTTEVSVTNSTSPITLLSYTLPGGTLSTGNIVVARIWCRAVQPAFGDSDTNITLKYDGTTVVSISAGVQGGVSTDGPFIIDAVLFATGSASTQRGMLNVVGNVESGPFGTGTSTKDSSGDLDVTITMNWSGAYPGRTFYKYISWLSISEVA